MKNQTIINRFLDKVCKNGIDGCWNFVSSISHTGSGRFFMNGKCRDAYRVSYELFIGEIPKGHELHHICENRLCVNPDHLKVLTRKDHLKCSPTQIAYMNAHKTHCPQGHEYTEDNLVPYLFKLNGKRSCLICAKKRSRECNARKRLLNKYII